MMNRRLCTVMISAMVASLLTSCSPSKYGFEQMEHVDRDLPQIDIPMIPGEPQDPVEPQDPLPPPPSGQPSGEPSGQPSGQPGGEPSGQPSGQPSGEPSGQPSGQPSGEPSGQPGGQPSGQPSSQPSGTPDEPRDPVPSPSPTGQTPGKPGDKPEQPKPPKPEQPAKPEKPADPEVPAGARCDSRGGEEDKFVMSLNGKKVLICHVPAGNPAAQHEICISVNGAINGHQVPMDGSRGPSGDYVGRCESSTANRSRGGHRN